MTWEAASATDSDDPAAAAALAGGGDSTRGFLEELVDAVVSERPCLPRKSFSEVSERQQRRRDEYKRDYPRRWPS
jgi:hypothetical protein